MFSDAYFCTIRTFAYLIKVSLTSVTSDKDVFDSIVVFNPNKDTDKAYQK